MDISAQTIRELFTYDPIEGLLRWRNQSGRYGKIPAGTVAGCLNGEGYRYVTFDGKRWRACRVIWAWMTGDWPKDQVDHIDHNTSNDRWANLREATSSQNKANCRTYKKKTCSLKGVQAVQKRHSVRYRAVVTKDGVKRNLGNFDTELEAHMAYVRAAEALHGVFACAGGSAH